jgi:gluconolactonase
MRLIPAACAVSAVLFAAVPVLADDNAPAVPKAVKLVDVVDELHAGKAREIFIEGPAVDADGSVLFSDEAHLPESRILKWDPAARKLTVWREKANRANGMTFDAEGRLITCEGSRNPGGARRVARRERDGTVTVLADSYGGKKLNSPNDAVVDRAGRVWFTDACYLKPKDDVEQDCEGVYRIDRPGTPQAKVVRVLGKGEVVRPNGIAVSTDEKTLYVSDSPGEKGVRELLLAYDIAADGSLSGRRVVYDFGPERGIDGMRLDRDGLIYGTAGAGAKSGIYVIDPRDRSSPGKLVMTVPLPETPGNCAWGGPDGRTLYVTASRGLYAIRFPARGSGLFPAALSAP